MSEEKRIDIPTTKQFETELKRLRYKESFRKTLWSTISSLVVVSAIAIIISTMLLPVLRVTGTSMTPTLQNGDVLLCSKISDYECGDVIAFYYNNKVLLKRVIATGGMVVDIDEAGVIYVNGEKLDEPYVSEVALGESDQSYPMTIQDGRLFVVGDHRAVSIDSRSTSIGCIAEENIIGKVVLRVYPFGRFGTVE